MTNAQLLLVSHADAARYIKGPLNGGMFNLGWLPGSDRTVFTRRRAPKYFLFGVTFLLFSFLVPYKLYYILFGTLLTVFSVVCLFFAVPAKTDEKESAFD